jgi:hypothetical protein
LNSQNASLQQVFYVLFLGTLYRAEMIIDYTKHAAFRMKYRKISETEVENTIRHSDSHFVTQFGRSVTLKKYGGKYL